VLERAQDGKSDLQTRPVRQAPHVPTSGSHTWSGHRAHGETHFSPSQKFGSMQFCAVHVLG
jgi:hypothetical protein